MCRCGLLTSWGKPNDNPQQNLLKPSQDYDSVYCIQYIHAHTFVAGFLIRLSSWFGSLQYLLPVAQWTLHSQVSKNWVTCKKLLMAWDPTILGVRHLLFVTTWDLHEPGVFVAWSFVSEFCHQQTERFVSAYRRVTFKPRKSRSSTTWTPVPCEERVWITVANFAVQGLSLKSLQFVCAAVTVYENNVCT